MLTRIMRYHIDPSKKAECEQCGRAGVGRPNIRLLILDDCGRFGCGDGGVLKECRSHREPRQTISGAAISKVNSDPAMAAAAAT